MITKEDIDRAVQRVCAGTQTERDCKLIRAWSAATWPVLSEAWGMDSQVLEELLADLELVSEEEDDKSLQSP